MNEKILSILLPTDFSEASKTLIFNVFEAFQGIPCKFTLVNSFEAPHAGATMLVSIEDILEKDSEEELESLKNELIGKFPERSGYVNVFSKHGSIDFVLKKVVDAYHADLIIMATEGASGMKKLLVGSTASNVVRTSTVPTLIVPANVGISSNSNWYFATDLTQNLSNKELRLVTKLADNLKAQLKSVHVASDERVSEEAEIQWMNQFPSEQGKVLEIIHNPNTVESLISWVKAQNGHLLIMTRHEHGLIDRVLGKSHTQQASMKAELPILVLPGN